MKGPISRVAIALPLLSAIVEILASRFELERAKRLSFARPFSLIIRLSTGSNGRRPLSGEGKSKGEEISGMSNELY